jgi:hypothetical protein
MRKRRCFKQLLSLGKGLYQDDARLRAKAEELPLGVERKKPFRRDRQAEIDERLASPGLPPAQ